MVSLLLFELYNLFSAAQVFPPPQELCSQITLSHYLQPLFADPLPSMIHRFPLSWRTLLYLAFLTLLKSSLLLNFIPLVQFLNEWSLQFDFNSHQQPEIDYFSSNNSNKSLFSNAVVFSLLLFSSIFLK